MITIKRNDSTWLLSSISANKAHNNYIHILFKVDFRLQSLKRLKTSSVCTIHEPISSLQTGALKINLELHALYCSTCIYIIRMQMNVSNINRGWQLQ